MSSSNVLRLWRDALTLNGEKLDFASGDILQIRPTIDDTGAIHFGDGTNDIDVKMFLGSTTEYVDFNVGDSNVRFNVPLRLDNNTGAAAASGLLMGGGTTADPVTTSTADGKFFEFRCQSSATSGDNRLLYLRYELSGTGGGECIRAFTKIQGTIGTARGAHISIDFDTTVGDKVTGLAAGLDCQLLLPNKAIEAGVGAYTALNIEIYSAGATTDPANCNKLSYIRVSNGGNASGVADVDDDAYFIDMVGVTEGAGNMVVASATETNYATAAKCRINGVEKWLMFASASG